ncbi:MAG: hypothetical protein IJ555_08030 [Ruminococcus sp.]|nr:hypothetical protein [Ruminococcus sp.]
MRQNICYSSRIRWRLLWTLSPKICDSKGDRAYHPFGGDGKCIVEFIHADGCLPSCVAFTGNYGSFYWDGLIFDNIESIQKINYGEKAKY